jgi:hypothetical protein
MVPRHFATLAAEDIRGKFSADARRGKTEPFPATVAGKFAHSTSSGRRLKGSVSAIPGFSFSFYSADSYRQAVSHRYR